MSSIGIYQSQARICFVAMVLCISVLGGGLLEVGSETIIISHVKIRKWAVVKV